MLPDSKENFGKEYSVADLRKVIFGQNGHFHNGIAVDAVLQHGTDNFQLAFITGLIL